MVNITITDSAQVYLAELLSKQEGEVLGVRMFVNQPGTPGAETCIAYCREDDATVEDETRSYPAFTAYFEKRSVPFLDEAMVDYASDKFGGQLTIKAPNSKMPRARLYECRNTSPSTRPTVILLIPSPRTPISSLDTTRAR